MPCQDITEEITLSLNAEDRIRSYNLKKQSCGRAVGEADLLLSWVVGKHIDEFLQIDVDDFLDHFNLTDETEEFLHLKHFFALKIAGQVLVGAAPGGPLDSCAVESIGCDAEGMEILAHLNIDLLTKKIKSCGRCTGCGVSKLKRKPAVDPATLQTDAEDFHTLQTMVEE